MMPVLPLLLSTWWADLNLSHQLLHGNLGLERPYELIEQGIRLGMNPEHLRIIDKYYPSSLSERLITDLYYRSWPDILRPEERDASTITEDKNNFKVFLDVHQFRPEEIDVKVIERTIVIKAKHEEKKDEHGFVSRQFVRKYLLPNEVDVDKVSSSISTDGILTVIAPLKESTENANERNIKIEFTGKPAITRKDDEKKPADKGSREEATTKKTTGTTEGTTTPQK